MTWKELLLLFAPLVFDLLKALIIPGSLVIIACLFREQIAGLINRIKGGKIWGAEFEATRQDQAATKLKMDARSEPSLGNLRKLSPSEDTQVVSYIRDQVPKVRGYGGGEVTETAKPAEPVSAPASAPADHNLPPLVRGTGPFYAMAEKAIREDPRIRNLSDQGKIDVLVGAQAITQSHLIFERIYRAIFGSQLFALRMADRPGGVPLKHCEEWFNSAKARFPDIHQNRTFEQWCKFLTDTGLAYELPKVGDTRMAGVTELGHQFLMYVTDQRYLEPPG